MMAPDIELDRLRELRTRRGGAVRVSLSMFAQRASRALDAPRAWRTPPGGPIAPSDLGVDCGDPALGGGVLGFRLGVLATLALEQQLSVSPQVDDEVWDVAQRSAAEAIRDLQEQMVVLDV